MTQLDFKNRLIIAFLIALIVFNKLSILAILLLLLFTSSRLLHLLHSQFHDCWRSQGERTNYAIQLVLAIIMVLHRYHLCQRYAGNKHRKLGYSPKSNRPPYMPAQVTRWVLPRGP